MVAKVKEEMTGLERTLAALEYKKPDRIPVASLVCGASRRILGTTYDKWASDAELCADSLLQAHELLGFDAFVTLVDLSIEAECHGQPVIYPMENTPYSDPNNPVLKSAKDYHNIESVNMRETGRAKMLIDVINRLSKAKGKEVAIGGFVYAPLGVLGAMRGHEKMFVDCIKNRKDLIAGCEALVDDVIDYALAQVEAGAHAIVMDTLYASASIMNPKMWAEIEGPFAKKISEAVKKAGAGLILHNCGGGIYFDAQQEWTDPVAISHAYPAADCKTWEEHVDKWGKKIVSVGAMDPAKVGMLTDPQGAMEYTREFIECFKDKCDGGFILSTGCEFPPNGSLLNAIAIMDAVKAYGYYE